MDGDTDTSMRTPDDAAALSHIFPIGYSYYAEAKSLTPAFYQTLVDRCWRRSGTLLYRPNQKGSCCPHYTLRLDAAGFRPTKDQRQAINRFNKYVLGETYSKELARLHPRSREEARKRDNEFDLVARIAEPELASLTTAAATTTTTEPPKPAHEFVVTLEPDTFTEEKYLVFENYQRLVHHEPPNRISRTGFKRFLCNSPLEQGTMTGPDGKERKLGSFHQCYRLDGQLVAMGVLDLLPDCVSAVYFLYHESIHKHSPGKIGALREIALALDQGYRWWYSGFYIHSCPKMKYKVDFSPQYVLDPETLEWDLFDKEAVAIFDSKPYVSLSQERLRAAGKLVEEEATAAPPPPRRMEVDDEKEDDDGSSFLFDSNMPGIPSLEDMLEVDMDNLLLFSDRVDGPFLASQLVVWESQGLEYGTLKARIAELVAALGPDLLGEYAVDFRSNRVS
ncbi:hypothetical protein OQA88_12324 [Cercophora sp. LCS_1]